MYISVEFELIQVLSLDVIEGFIKTHIYLKFQWTDELIQWNITKNSACFRFERSKVWTPDIVIQNSLDYVPHLGFDSQPVSISYQGMVLFEVQVKPETACSMDVTRFPFDQQTCVVIISSNNYYAYELYMNPFVVYDGVLIQNGEWDVVGVTADNETELTQIYHGHYKSVAITLNRRHLYYVVNLLLPMLLISSLNPTVFLVKADTGEKLSTSLALFLSFTMFLSILSGMLPQTSTSSSLVSLYVCVQLHLSGLYVIVCILIIRVSNMKELNTVTRFIAKCTIRTNRVRQITGKETTGSPDSTSETDVTTLHDVSDKMDRFCFFVSVTIHLILTTLLVYFITL
ncbi:neuronal acetylcholine receptor subunit alpha-7-like [Haliotis asinina]|uniref:neuronal acetylcholine receptor subunit alpha-7-like n=1 Tax=Haliotis asinina TaxID=109174 RepID=UPI003531CA81